MPCKGPVQKRLAVNDPVYGSPLASQLISKALLDGKEPTAGRTVYGTLELCEGKAGTDPVLTLKRAVENVRPALEVHSRRTGGAAYQVPVEVRPGHGTALALRWLPMFPRQHRGNTMTERLASETPDASNDLGASVKRCESTHKVTEADRAFAHYR